MSALIAGGCACGAVRYESSGEIEFSFHCHCRKCQRATGGGHASAFVLHRDEVELTGEIKFYEQTSDSGYAAPTGFCPNCGSPLVCKTAQSPDRLYFHVATLDDPSTFRPTFVVYEDAALPWDHVNPALSSAGK